MNYPDYYINYDKTEAIRFDDARHLIKVRSNTVSVANFSENAVIKNCYTDTDAFRIRASFIPCDEFSFNQVINKVMLAIVWVAIPQTNNLTDIQIIAKIK